MSCYCTPCCTPRPCSPCCCYSPCEYFLWCCWPDVSFSRLAAEMSMLGRGNPAKSDKGKGHLPDYSCLKRKKKKKKKKWIDNREDLTVDGNLEQIDDIKRPFYDNRGSVSGGAAGQGVEGVFGGPQGAYGMPGGAYGGQGPYGPMGGAYGAQGPYGPMGGAYGQGPYGAQGQFGAYGGELQFSSNRPQSSPAFGGQFGAYGAQGAYGQIGAYGGIQGQFGPQEIYGSGDGCAKMGGYKLCSCANKQRQSGIKMCQCSNKHYKPTTYTCNSDEPNGRQQNTFSFCC